MHKGVQKHISIISISKWQHLSVHMLPIAILHVLANGDDKARRWLGGFKPQSSDNGEAGTQAKNSES